MMRIPTVTKNLLLINVIAFILMWLLQRVSFMGGTPTDLNNIFGLHFFLATDFQFYQLFTYMFMHANLEHIFFNMFALWMFGMVVEQVWGPRRFLFYYIICGIGAGIFQEAAQFCSFYLTVSSHIPSFTIGQLPQIAYQLSPMLNNWTTVGASGAIYAILLAFGMLFPNERLFIIPIPIPIKAKFFVMIYAGIQLVMALSTTSDNVAHLAHLGGMIVGFFLIRYWRRHPGVGNNALQGQQFFDNLKRKWDHRKQQQGGNGNATHVNGDDNVNRQSDWEYNRRKQEDQEEVDRILDKIRKSGYDSLSADEKRRLFESSKKN